MKYFIIFYFYLNLTYGGIIKTTERSEPIDTTTVSKMLNVTVKDEDSSSEKSIAQTRDEEATIMLAHDTLFTVFDAAKFKSDVQMVDGERSGKLLLLSTPKLTEKSNTEEEKDENIEESITMGDEMKAESKDSATEKNSINNNEKKEKKDNEAKMAVTTSSQPTISSKILMEGNENLKKEMEMSVKREIEIDAPASNAKVFHLDHDESLDYVLVVNGDSHALHTLQADLYPATIVESAHFVPASKETDVHW